MGGSVADGLLVEVGIKCLGQMRVRHYVRGGYVGVYKADKQKCWEEELGMKLRGLGNVRVMEGLLGVRMVFEYCVKGVSRRGRYRNKKPDVDNVVKNVMDVFTQVGVWVDDRVVVKVEAEKWDSDRDWLRVEVYEMGGV